MDHRRATFWNRLRYAGASAPCANLRGRKTCRAGKPLRLESLEMRWVFSAGAATGEIVDQTAAVELRALESDADRLWLDLDLADRSDEGASPTVAVLESSSDHLTASVSLPGLQIDQVDTVDGAFTELTLVDSAYTTETGAPQLPVVRHYLAVPDDATIDARLTGDLQKISLAGLGLNNPVLPAQPSQVKREGQEEAFVLDESAYQADAYSSLGIQVVEAGYSAGQRLVLVEIQPVAYNPVEQSIQVYTNLTFEVAIQAVKGSGGESPDGGVTLSDASAKGDSSDSSKGTRGRLLVIAADAFLGDTLNTYVAHKESLGWTVDLASTSVAGTTTTDIQNYILGRYNNLDTRPDALLLVGDTAQIPKFEGLASDTPATDLYYTTMDGSSDWFPEFPVGRFSVTSLAELANVVNKTIDYETADDAAWMHQAAFIASKDPTYWSVTEATHEWTIANYMDDWGYTSTRLYAHSGATSSQVITAVNSGQALAVYSGHGSATTWADVSMTQTMVRNLTNLGMYPLVLSFACQTGSFEDAECFAETWLRESGKGGVAVLGATEDSYWDEDDILQKMLFTAIYQENQTAFGDAVLRAKELFLEHYGAGTTTRRYFEMYNLLGDPTVSPVGLSVRITSSATLANAYPGQSYDASPAVAGGRAPYTWSITEGSLPDGLSLDPDAGQISGTPTTAGTASFTLTVTDALAATFSQAAQIAVLEPLVMTSPSSTIVAGVDQSFSVTFEAAGGTEPYTWSIPGDYSASTPAGGYLGLGTGQGWSDDERISLLTLPWSFTYFGSDFNSVWVSSNGYLDFTNSTNQYSNSTGGLLSRARIAPLWDDLDTSSGDIYVQADDDYLAVRWAGNVFEGEAIDFEAVLYRDGRIQFNYGSDHVGLTPTVGISAGDGSRYNLASLGSDGTIAAGTSILFTPPGSLPPGLTWNPQAETLSGTPTAAGTYEFDIQVQDASVLQETNRQRFTLQVIPFSTLALDLPAKVWEGQSGLTGMVYVNQAPSQDIVVSLVSSDSSQVQVPAAVLLPAGETSVPFAIEPQDDALEDGVFAATITATVTGVAEASGSLAVGDNELHQVIFSDIADPQAQGVPFSVTLRAADVNGDTIDVYSGSLTLSAEGDHGSVGLESLPGAVVLADGFWSGQVTLTAMDTGVALAAADVKGTKGQSNRFAVVEPGRIEGSVWNDADADGALDAGESPAPGETVFLDDNLNGQLDAAEASAVTDEEGAYVFDAVAPGTRYVAVALGTDRILSSPTGGSTVVDVTAGVLAEAGTLGVHQPKLDIDASGDASPMTDGLLVLRYLLGFRGEALVQNVVSALGDRIDPDQIASYLQRSQLAMLDADDSGTAAGLTDGLLILRYLLDFRGEPLVSNVLGGDARRTDPDEIAAFLAAHLPSSSKSAPASEAGLETEPAAAAVSPMKQVPADARAAAADAVWSAEPLFRFDSSDRPLRSRLFRHLAPAEE